MADFTPTQAAETLSSLFHDEKYADAVSKILMGRRVKDRAFEQIAAKAFVERAIVGLGEHNFMFGSNSDMFARAANLIGVNDKGKSLIDDEHYCEVMLREILPRAMGEVGDAQFFNSELAHALIVHMEASDNSKFPSYVQSVMDEFLTPGKKSDFVNKVKDEKLSNPLSPEKFDVLYEKFNRKVKGAPTLEAENKSTPELSDEALKPDYLAIEAAAEKAYLNKTIAADLRTEALLRINKIMDDNPEIVRRKVVDKLKDKLTQSGNEWVNPNQLVYPSESIFSDTISMVDTNGRVTKELFGIKKALISREPKIEFVDKSPSPQAYELAALHALKAGIKFPHVGSTFRDPKIAIGFMQGTVDALVEAGYPIEDISVDPHLRKAFEHHVANHHSQRNTLSEAPDALKVDPNSPEMSEQFDPKPIHPPREPMPEEIAHERNERINKHAANVKEAMESSDTPLEFKDLKQEDKNGALALATLLDSGEADWNDFIANTGISPAVRSVVEHVKAEFSKLLDLADPDTQSKRQLGSNETKVLIGAYKEMREVFGEEPRFTRAFSSLKATLKANRAAQENNQSVEPDNNIDVNDPSLNDSSGMDQHEMLLNSQNKQPLMGADVSAEQENHVDIDIDNQGMQTSPSSPDEPSSINKSNDLKTAPPVLDEKKELDGSQLGIDDDSFSNMNSSPVGDSDFEGESPGDNSLRGEARTKGEEHDSAPDWETPPLPDESDIPPDNNENDNDNMDILLSSEVVNGANVDNDQIDLNSEQWVAIANTGWSDLNAEQVVLLTSLSNQQKAYLSTVAISQSKLAAPVLDNIKNVEAILSDFHEDLSGSISKVELQFLSNMPESLLGQEQKRALSDHSPQEEKIKNEQESDNITNEEAVPHRPKM